MACLIPKLWVCFHVETIKTLMNSQRCGVLVKAWKLGRATHRKSFHLLFWCALCTLTWTVHPVISSAAHRIAEIWRKIWFSQCAYAGACRMGDLFGQRTVLLWGALLLLVLPTVTHSFFNFNFVNIRVSK